MKLLSVKKEHENVEFKEAKNSISVMGKDGKQKKSAYGYLSALANEGGGKLVLGVENEVNQKTGMRDVVGTNAVQDISEAKSLLYRKMQLRVSIEEEMIEEKRIVILAIPSRPKGKIIRFYDVPLMRVGEELVVMDEDRQREILLEEENDYSVQYSNAVTSTDLDPHAIDVLKDKWLKKSGNIEIESYSREDVLRKLLLVREGRVTNAAILLLGSEECLALHMPQAEFIFEWRARPESIDFELRKTFRKPFIIVIDEIWSLVNTRNYRVPKTIAFVEEDIWAYRERPVREGLLNAFAHREYRGRTEPSFVKLTPGEIVIKSPGGFVLGVNADNALYVEGKWRNRFLMEVLERVGFVERSSAGLDRIYTACISDGKGIPKLQELNQSIILQIPAIVKDAEFAKYLDKISREKQIDISLDQLIELERIRSEKHVKTLEFSDFFLEHGLVDKVGKGRGVKYILSHNYYKHQGLTGEYTRIAGLSRQTKKQLILEHLEKNKNGSLFGDIREAFPELKAKDVSNLLQDLRREKKCRCLGRSVKGVWKIGT